MKKTLGVLLVIPFAVAVLGFVNIAVMHNAIQVDISGIAWDYSDAEGFKIDDGELQLEATPIFDPSYSLAEGNDLVWSCSSLEEGKKPFEVENRDGTFYLTPLEEGLSTVTCQNEKGNVRRSFKAYAYEDGAVIINDVEYPSSGAMIGNLRKYGTLEFDSEGKAVPATLSLEATVYGAAEEAVPTAYSDNLFVLNDGQIRIAAGGESYITYTVSSLGDSVSSTYRFYAVEGAVNVGDYNDLLLSTNKSETGFPVCLQRNLLSLRETYPTDEEGNYLDEPLYPNTKLFGNYDFTSRSFSFGSEVYRFVTTYNHEYLDQLQDEDESLADVDEVVAGIRLRQSFYGNGFSINMHELCFPTHGSIGETSGILTPGEGDLFEGPLYFVAVGPTALPFVAAYGQDNCGLYVDGDNIVIDDLDIRNTSDTDNLYDLTYTGSVIDVSGKNVVIRNCLVHNGRVAVRAFSSDNLSIENCYLYRAREFLLKLGNDEYEKPDPASNVSYSGVSGPLSSVLGGEGTPGDELWTNAVTNGGASYLEGLRAIQRGLDNRDVGTPTNVRVVDTTFSNSGLFSIAMETLFNGAYLYNGTPSGLFSLVGSLGEGLITIPENIGGTSRPVNLVLEGDTRFYDFKAVDSIDASCLIEQNLGQLVNPAPGIDDYFPMRRLLEAECDSLRYNYYPDGPGGEAYINPIVGYYGGGYNASSVDYGGLDTNPFGEEIEIDFAGAVFSTSTGNRISDLLAHCVPLAAGMNAFRFLTSGSYEGKPYLYGENPNVDDIYQRGGDYDEIP